MGEKQLQELGYRLTGVKISFDLEDKTVFRVRLKEGICVFSININCKQLDNYHTSLKQRGFSLIYLSLQALLHEVAHYRQFLKYGRQDFYLWADWYLTNEEKAQKIADRYALMYYRRFVENAIYT